MPYPGIEREVGCDLDHDLPVGLAHAVGTGDVERAVVVHRERVVAERPHRRRREVERGAQRAVGADLAEAHVGALLGGHRERAVGQAADDPAVGGVADAHRAVAVGPEGRVQRRVGADLHHQAVVESADPRARGQDHEVVAHGHDAIGDAQGQHRLEVELGDAVRAEPGVGRSVGCVLGDQPARERGSAEDGAHEHDVAVGRDRHLADDAERQVDGRHAAVAERRVEAAVGQVADQQVAGLLVGQHHDLAVGLAGRDVGVVVAAGPARVGHEPGAVAEARVELAAPRSPPGSRSPPA